MNAVRQWMKWRQIEPWVAGAALSLIAAPAIVALADIPPCVDTLSGFACDGKVSTLPPCPDDIITNDECNKGVPAASGWTQKSQPNTVNCVWQPMGPDGNGGCIPVGDQKSSSCQSSEGIGETCSSES